MAKPRIVIIGAGFGGLFAAKELANQPVDVVLIDRNNYHTFTPLLYQVATCALNPSEVSYPVRTIFRDATNIRFLLGNVINIDAQTQTVSIEPETGGAILHENYDQLIIAAGAEPNYFGNDDYRRYSYELDSVSDAVRLRNHILRMFERATWTQDAEGRRALTTIVVVGGGPTGLETAGAIYELYNHVLNAEFPHEDLSARVVLVEMRDHLLHPYPESLQKSALKQLRSLGVEAHLGVAVDHVAEDHVLLSDGTTIRTHTLIWAAGVAASDVGDLLDIEKARGGSIPIEPTTQVIGQPGMFAVGDVAYLEDPEGKPYPLLIPVAQQQGRLAAKNILRQMNGEAMQTFKYRDRGIMATIGRSRAVAWIFYRFKVTGPIAWMAWLFLHVITLLGFRNRLAVLINWTWNYLTYDRSVRIILGRSAYNDFEESLARRSQSRETYAPEPAGD
ncbi:MAG: NAD(P)/FAD-dependent oxidoreductase [Anaerolineales bacterium]